MRKEIECRLISMTKQDVCRSLADEHDLGGNRERAMNFRRAAVHDRPEGYLTMSEYFELSDTILEIAGESDEY